MRSAVAFCALLAALVCSPGQARADVTVGGGATFVRLGGRRATGGWAPSVSLELPLRRLGPRVELTYRNSLWAFNFSDARWLGVVDQSAMSVSFEVDRFRVAPGLALELMTVPLCTDLGHCGRSWGVAPAGVLAVSGGLTGRWGATFSGTARYVPAEPQPGWSGSASLVGTYSW